MKISARVDNAARVHKVIVETNGSQRAIAIPAKETGSGSAVNGGELLCLALATCYCNDLYREAAKRGIAVTLVEVDVDAEFGSEGEPARSITYTARVEADADDTTIRELVRQTDTVAEVQNTLRRGIAVEFRNL